MKNSLFRLFSILAIALGTVFVFAGCERDEGLTFRPTNLLGDNAGQVPGEYAQLDRLYTADQLQIKDKIRLNLQQCDFDLNYTPSVPLTDIETENVTYFRKAEKMGRDLYVAFYDLWDYSMFDIAANSEQNHMDAMLLLIDLYGLPDPVADLDPGVFNDPDLEARYTELLTRGTPTLNEAMIAGAVTQEYEIAELTEALAIVENGNVVTIYNNLLLASRNHLRSFVKRMAILGITYTPEILTAEAFDEIMSVDWETGHRGKNW